MQSNLKDIQILRLGYDTMPGRGLRAIARSCPHLKALRFYGGLIPPQAWKDLFENSSLAVLSVFSPINLIEGLQLLTTPCTISRLALLLCRGSRMQFDKLDLVCLEELQLSWHIDDTDIRNLVQSGIRLKSLWLTDTNVTQSTMDLLTNSSMKYCLESLNIVPGYLDYTLFCEHATQCTVNNSDRNTFAKMCTRANLNYVM